MPYIRVVEAGRDQVFRLGPDKFTVGRDAENSAVLDDKQCSRRHFEIQPFEGGWKVVDLESKNGTRVNGRFVNSHLLRAGDKIMVGDAVLAYLEHAPDAAVPVSGGGGKLEIGEPLAPGPPMIYGPGPVLPRPGPPGAHAGPGLSATRRRPASSPSAATFIITFIVLAGVTGGLVMYSQREDPAIVNARHHFETGRDLYDKMEFARAIEELQQVPAAQSALWQEANRLIKDCKDKIRRRKENDLRDRADRRLREIQNYADVHRKETEKILAMCEEFDKEYEGHPFKDRLQNLVATVKSGRQTTEVQDLWNTARQASLDAERRNRYSEALKALEEFENRNPLSEHKEELLELKEKVRQDADVYLGNRTEEADKKVQAKAWADAEAIYADLLSALGESDAFYEMKLLVQKRQAELARLKAAPPGKGPP